MLIELYYIYMRRLLKWFCTDRSFRASAIVHWVQWVSIDLYNIVDEIIGVRTKLVLHRRVVDEAIARWRRRCILCSSLMHRPYAYVAQPASGANRLQSRRSFSPPPLRPGVGGRWPLEQRHILMHMWESASIDDDWGPSLMRGVRVQRRGVREWDSLMKTKSPN